MSRSRAVYAKLESNSEPERVRVCQRVAVRASESQSGSHREISLIGRAPIVSSLLEPPIFNLKDQDGPWPGRGDLKLGVQLKAYGANRRY